MIPRAHGERAMTPDARYQFVPIPPEERYGSPEREALIAGHAARIAGLGLSDPNAAESTPPIVREPHNHGRKATPVISSLHGQFPTVKAAAKALRIKPPAIYYALRFPDRTCKGAYWSYADATDAAEENKPAPAAQAGTKAGGSSAVPSKSAA